MEKQKLMLSMHGTTEYKIVVPEMRSENEDFAAREMKKYLEIITGASFELVTDACPAAQKEIILGRTNKRINDGFTRDTELGNEGFIIDADNTKLYIVGGKKRGLMYGVYTFLENYCSCRFFAPDCEKIPFNPDLTVEVSRDVQIPAFEYRESHFRPAFGGLFNAKLKCNGSRVIEEKELGGIFKIFPFAHSFDKLVPVAEYFDTHPEYFSEKNGERINVHTQLCLTNPDVLEIAVRRILDWIEKDPGIAAVDISQNDWGNPCDCPECRKVYERTGAYSGAIVEFANKVAERVTKVYPEMLFTIFAYQYSRNPPHDIRTHPSVSVRLCGFECCCVHPVETAQCTGTVIGSCKPGVTTFKDDVEKWSQCCERLIIWSYVVNFLHTLLPFPNFYTLAPDIQFYRKSHAIGIFAEGKNTQGEHGELNALRQYLIAKLLWNPDTDVEETINDFINGYYGNAAPEIREYFDLIHSVITPETHTGIYGRPDALSTLPPVMDKARELFKRALSKELTDAERYRVTVAALSPEYMQLSLIPLDEEGRMEKLEEFFARAQELNIATFREGQTFESSCERIRLGKHLYL